MRLRTVSFSSLWAILFLSAAVFTPGCSRQAEIREYTVKVDVTDRMLGAIVLREDVGWFFKITGPIDDMAAAEKPFRDFVSSLRFPTEGDASKPPQWSLPEGWTSSGKTSEMRIATIDVPLKSGSRELTVIALPMQSASDPQQYLLSNINRWRDQLGRHKLQADEVASELETLKADGVDVMLVDVTGKAKAGGMSAAPFAGRG